MAAPQEANGDFASATLLDLSDGQHWGVCFSQDGEWLLATGAYSKVRLWRVSDLPSVNELHVAQQAGDETYQGVLPHQEIDVLGRAWRVAVSRDRTRVAAGLIDAHSVLVAQVEPDTARVRAETQLKGASNFVRSVVFSPCQRYLASSSDDMAVYIWDLETMELETRLDDATSFVLTLAWRGRYLAAAGYDNVVRVYEDARSDDSLPPCFGEPVEHGHHKQVVDTVAFHPHRDWLASGGEDGQLVISQLPALEIVHAFPKEDNTIKCARFTDVGNHVITSSYSGELRVHHCVEGNFTLLQAVQLHDSMIYRFDMYRSLLVAGTSSSLIAMQLPPALWSSEVVPFLLASKCPSSAVAQHLFGSDLFEPNLLPLILGYVVGEAHHKHSFQTPTRTHDSSKTL